MQRDGRLHGQDLQPHRSNLVVERRIHQLFRAIYSTFNGHDRAGYDHGDVDSAPEQVRNGDRDRQPVVQGVWMTRSASVSRFD